MHPNYSTMKIEPFCTTISYFTPDIEYNLTFFHAISNRYEKDRFKISKYNPEQKSNNVILTLPFHPDITPENVAVKLPTYLTFL